MAVEKILKVFFSQEKKGKRKNPYVAVTDKRKTKRIGVPMGSFDRRSK